MIGQTIRDLRKLKKMSQSELAKVVGVSQTTVTAWETGKAEPSSSAISSLADYFDVTTDYLLGRPDKKDDNTKTADIDDDDVIFTYEGRQIPKEDLELIRRIMRGTRNDIK
ncbi:helix-turn-helix transcriptional regulator [Lactobacillus salivarius]|uniref:helix-turn-helix domain-containing protein n=1 Tax=Ligilactobacillus salivarius TaxID=1624 RepID=UPI00136BCE01|nr:helix-turn-helix transcriptional regulator [Ligilactobacillus salivarius]MYZ04507.1 helix-turn-helix transcriptional regulator [Ligilactobacillus salivarius]